MVFVVQQVKKLGKDTRQCGFNDIEEHHTKCSLPTKQMYEYVVQINSKVHK